MISIFQILLLPLGILVYSNPSFCAAKKTKFPLVEAVAARAIKVEDKITVVNRQPERHEVEKKISRGEVLKDKALIRTGEKSELRLLLHKDAIFSLAENSEVLFPAIEWEDGSVSEINLHKGQFRFICKEDCEQKLITPLFEGLLPPGDLIFRYDPLAPEIEVSVLQGELSFRGLENETAVAVKAGQRISFKGMLENNEPAFDVLLKGRKVAKGQLGSIREIPPEELMELQKQEENKKKVVKIAPKSNRKASQICDRPWGEINQCVWTCEGNKKNAKECLFDQGATCVRQRCNANGQWSDRLELPSQNSPCRAKPLIGACDY